MMEAFKDMLLKRQKEQIKKPVDKDKMAAKAAMMKQLSEMLGKDMAGDMGDLKKVTVASNSKEGLKEGLEKARGIIEKKPDIEEELEESKEEEDLESPEEEEKELEEGSESPEDIEQKIKELEDQLAKVKAKKAY